MTDVERYEPLPSEGAGLSPAEQLVFRWLVTKRSPHTRFNYGLDLGVRIQRPGTREDNVPVPGDSRAPGWLVFCAGAGIDPLAVRQEHMGTWARLMEANGLAPATVARKLAAVSSWYSWLTANEHLEANPVKQLPRPELDQDTSKTHGLTRDQALKMLAAADDASTPQAARNAALLALLLYTGARAAEVCGANMADLGMDRGHRVLSVTRKGGKTQSLVLPPPVLQRLEAYFTERRDLERLPVKAAGAAGRDMPLIATSTGSRLRPADVWGLMRRLARSAKLPDELAGTIGAHSMRHSFATLYLDAGGNLRDLQDAMGHKDPRTTRRYDRARGLLDRSPGYKLAEYLADGE